jgi:hypothetical protein
MDLEPFTMLTGAGGLVGAAIAAFSGVKTYQEIAAKRYVSAATYGVRLALSTLVAIALIGFTFGLFPGLATIDGR